jgi:glycosyltransferase involved in cell wall biosynthesis
MPQMAPLMASPPADEGQPLVTIGIPTYERPLELERAVRSALVQDYGNLEVLVSDNASSDPGVQAVISRLAAATDPRLRLVRQPSNIGPVANFEWVLGAASGHYFMWLSDDDWLDPQYVSRCEAALSADATTMLVCGAARYYRNGVYVIGERPTNLTSRRPGVRLIRYFARVSTNGTIFGLARRTDLQAVGFPLGMGGDWLLVAALAARGRVSSLDGVHIHRSMSGSSANATDLARSYGLGGFAVSHPHLTVAGRVGKDIAFASPAFRGLSRTARLWVAVNVALLIVTRFTGAAFVRRLLGQRAAAAVETRIGAWLRRDRAKPCR